MELVLSMSYCELEQEEMMYLDGGATKSFKGSAASLRDMAGVAMVAFAGLATGASRFAKEYRKAHVFFSILVAKNSKNTHILNVHSFLGIGTGITYS